MTELNDGTLSKLPSKIVTPYYDRTRLKRGIAHFGVGNFHRAHQAFYIDRCLALPDQQDWGIVGQEHMSVGRQVGLSQLIAGAALTRGPFTVSHRSRVRGKNGIYLQ